MYQNFEHGKVLDMTFFSICEMQALLHSVVKIPEYALTEF